MKKNITLCADDYGQNESISEGILTLIESGRLSAVSCMTGYSHWSIYGEKLYAIKERIKSTVDIGLHFDLTEFTEQQGWSFNQLIISSCLGSIDLQQLEAEFIRQLDAFETALKMPPEFVDGHQHIHVFPNIRQVFIRVLSKRYRDHLPYIRLSKPAISGHDSGIKAIILRTLALGFSQLANQFHLKYPTQFLGMYSLAPCNYNYLFKGWLTQAQDGCLFMCHPGLASTDPTDPIKRARFVEYNYFSSDEFLQDLQHQHISLTKWSANHHKKNHG